MDINRMLKMMMNMAMRQLMRRGVNKAFSMGSRSAKAEQGTNKLNQIRPLKLTQSGYGKV